MESGLGPGTSYLDACAATPDVKAALEELLAGRRRSFSHEYPCHSPTEKRWFLLHASPLVEEGGVVVSHIDITRRKVLEGAPA
jgi:PAS domain-containing protein